MKKDNKKVSVIEKLAEHQLKKLEQRKVKGGYAGDCGPMQDACEITSCSSANKGRDICHTCC
ncbi:MAG TPA: hypothetical protein DCS93_03265 [Microscillaceae bacterium]|nr:hypothetical protein [Microscillaceae bacterium]